MVEYRPLPFLERISDYSPEAANAFATTQLAQPQFAASELPDIEHSFTHFDLVITPLVVRCEAAQRVSESGPNDQLWYDLAEPPRVGLPAPIKTLLGNLPERNEP